MVEMTRDEFEQIRATMSKVRKHLSRIHHDMNNPLSIISGNAQLLDELSKVLQVRDDFEAPLKDMVAAAEQLTGMIEELVVLRNLIAQLEDEEN